MAMKRTATTELNSDNWDQEEEPEDHGTFKAVGQEELSKRVIKVAKRRLQKNDEQRPLLSGLAGFAKTTTSVPDVKNAFSFLSNVNGSNAQSQTQSDTNVPPSNDNKTISQQPLENQYLSNIKTLNECLIDWLNTCIKKNPSCVFTPIFRDYEKHLEFLKPSSEKSDETKNNEVVSTFKFNSASSTNSPTSKSGSSPLNNETNIFSQAPTSATSNWLSSNPITKTNIFSNLSSNSSEKPTTPMFSFNNNDKPTSMFKSSTTDKSQPSIFNSNSSDKPQTSIFSSNSGDKSTVPMFNFSSKPTFQTTNTAETEKADKADDDEDAPPVNDFKPVTEDDAIYSQRVKVFFKSDKQYTDRGVGTLFIKEIKDSEDKKVYQAVVRADTSLGNVLFNIRLSADIPTKRVGKNNVMVACVPLPDMKTPIPVLLRVKTEEDADKLLSEINKYK